MNQPIIQLNRFFSFQSIYRLIPLFEKEKLCSILFEIAQYLDDNETIIRQEPEHHIIEMEEQIK